MGGLAKGIEDSKSMVAKAVEGVASDMVVNPNVSADYGTSTGSSTTSAMGADGLIGAIRDLISNMKDPSDGGGDIVIPVYLGGTLLDETIITAQQRANLRSGGR